MGLLVAFGSVGAVLGLWLFRLPFWIEVPLVAIVVLVAGFLVSRVMERRYPNHPLFTRQRRVER